jgi:catechol 2,3-dioxygenase-like lactoylglutathione lyase family enzyme
MFTTGINHVATLTTSMSTTIDFLVNAFGGTVTGEVEKSEHHPWMKIVAIGPGVSLNVFEVEESAMLGDRRSQGSRGAIDHFAFAVDSKATLEQMKDRLVDAGAQEVGEIQQLGDEWSLFFRGPDGMELEVCVPVAAG